VPGLTPRYWSVEDTTLDNTQSDINQGWQTELSGGDGKNILIQFRDLNRTLGPNKHIVKASLVFAISGGDRVSFVGASQVLQPWNEGPDRTLLSLNPEHPEDTAARWSATYRHRRAGTDGSSWNHAGATGEGDSKPIPEAKLNQPDQDHVEITGLEGAVQQQYDRPYENHGFVLLFSAPIAFPSGKSIQNKPKLVLQVEDSNPTSGPDLSVTYIERKPQYERYNDEGGYSNQTQDGQPVPFLDHPLNGLSRKWPSDGEDLIYAAHVKNVGDAPSQGFTAHWYQSEKPGDAVDFAQGLKPGEETIVPIHIPYRNQHSDHRIQPLGFRIEPKGPDAVAANNFVEIQESGLAVAAYVEKGFAEAAARKANAYGSHSVEDWVQQQVAVMNDVYFPYSRFSFATDGVTERLRVDKVLIVPDGSLQGPSAWVDGKSNLGEDVELGFRASDSDSLQAYGASADMAVQKKIANQVGLTDLTVTSIPAGDPRLQAVGKEGAVSRGTEDMFPGLMGGGDTRDESRLLSPFAVPYQPYTDPMVEDTKLQPTDLLSASDVAGLDTDLAKRRGYIGDYLYDIPTDIAVRILNYDGKKLPNVALTFYQMVNGAFANAPTFTLNSGTSGIASLFKRPPLSGGSAASTLTDHSLHPNPFGRVDYLGRNGVFLVKGELNGTAEWSVLKVTQAVDTFHRGQKTVAVMSLAFNLPSDPLDRTENVAKGRTATDSANSAASALTPLLDDSFATEVSLPSAPGSWVDIDLGRDRTIGEINLATKSSSFWNQFEIRTYSTGQKPVEAMLWSKESNWNWSYRNRPDVDSKHAGVMSVAYRGAAQRFRYIRLINTGLQAEAKLVQVTAIPIKQSG
jgi:hypothetical protein